MDKQAAKSMNKILKFLPKAAQAAVLFQNPPFSPGRDKRADINAHRHKTTAHHKVFSGPILPMIPAEARGRSKNFEAQEPTSPKISCMGQIKHKKKICQKQMSLPKGFKPESHPRPARTAGKAKPDRPPVVPELKKKPSGIKKMFGSRRKSDASVDAAGKPPLPDRAPSLGHMRKFASSRDTFVNFDWRTAQIAPEEDRGFDSDEERSFSDGDDDVIIPFSAPIMMAGRGNGAGLALEPRKEINLWKRRTMAQPKPLQLDMVRAQ